MSNPTIVGALGGISRDVGEEQGRALSNDSDIEEIKRAPSLDAARRRAARKAALEEQIEVETLEARLDEIKSQRRFVA